MGSLGWLCYGLGKGSQAEFPTQGEDFGVFLSSGKKPLKWTLEDSYVGSFLDKTSAGGGVK